MEDAERYAQEDAAEAARIVARNDLENFTYNLRNSIKAEYSTKLSIDDKATLEDAVTEMISWLDASEQASTEEYQERKAEIENTANMIVRSCLFIFTVATLHSRPLPCSSLKQPRRLVPLRP